jgi:hypothetical protein
MSDSERWWSSSLTPSCDVAVVGLDDRRRDAIARSLSGDGHRVTLSDPYAPRFPDGCTAMVLLPDLSPLLVGDVVRRFLAHLPAHAKVLSRFRPDVGQILWWIR